MSAAEVIAAKLSDGCAYRSGGWWRATCPAHGSRADTLALTDAQDGLRVYCHAGCQPEDILAALRRLELLVDESGGSGVPPDPAELERRRAVEARHRQQRITCARDILAAARPVACSPVERYLHTRIPGIAAVPEVIGY